MVPTNQVERRVRGGGDATVATKSTLRTQADQALDGLRSITAAPSPPRSGTLTAVRVLARVCTGLVRLRIRRFDAAD